MKKLFPLLIVLIASCSKQDYLPDPEPKPVQVCGNCALFSFKYEAGMYEAGREPFRIDTLWPLPVKGVKWMPAYVCDSNLLKVKAAKQIDTLDWYDCPSPVNFPTMKVEVRKYVYY